MGTVKEREIISYQPYCSYCKEDITTKLLEITDDNGTYKACPHCKEVMTNAN